MKLNIFAKLFITILTTAFVVMLFIMVFMNWSFRTGFTDYQYRNDLERAGRLTDVLAEMWIPNGSWEFIREDRHNWSLALAEIGEGRYANANRRQQRQLEQQLEQQGDRPPPAANPPPPPSSSLVRRMCLLDLDKRIVIGPHPGPNEKLTVLPIEAQGQVVGWLHVMQPEVITDALAGAFQEQQARNAYLIALFAIGLSALVAFLAARQFLRPVKRLAAGATMLAQGHYTAHIPISSQDELGDLAGHFNHLADSLKRNEELRAQWIADISHELRTPLAVLRSEVEALLDGIRQPTLDRIRSLHSEILSLGKLVDDLYQLSLSDSGEWDTSALETLDVNDILEDVLGSATQRLREKQIGLQAKLSPQPLRVRADAKRLRQVFGNLLENSYRYTDPQGRVVVSSQCQAGKVLVTVEDSTPGVPDEALPRLFDRLFRVDKSRSRALGGSGLGLSICKNIIEAQGGRIYAQHATLGGLAVHIELPVA